MWQKVLCFFTGRGQKLTIYLSHQTSLQVEKLGHGQYVLSDEPDQSYGLRELVVADKGTKGSVSRGAVLGAGLAAARGGDLLRGAIIGDQLEKMQDKQPYTLSLFFVRQADGFERQVSIRLTRPQIRQVRHFFGKV